MRLRLTESLLQDLMLESHAANEDKVEVSSSAASAIKLTRSVVKPQLGLIFQQYQQHEHFTLAAVQTQLENDIELTTEAMPTGVNMNFILSGSLFTRFFTLPHDITMGQAKHNILYTNNTSGYHIFRKGQLFHNLHISLSESYFKGLCPPTSRSTERVHTHMLKQMPMLVSPNHGNITLQMQQAIQGVLTCEFMGPMQKLFMEAKVLELLALQLNQFELEQEQQRGDANPNKMLAEELKLYLQLHYLNLPGIKELARIFATNEFRLKKVFRERFGRGIFSFAQELRLQHAHELLASGGSTVVEVAETLGYSHANHFTNAFRKYFGYPPSKLKK